MEGFVFRRGVDVFEKKLDDVEVSLATERGSKSKSVSDITLKMYEKYEAEFSTINSKVKSFAAENLLNETDDFGYPIYEDYSAEEIFSCLDLVLAGIKENGSIEFSLTADEISDSLVDITVVMDKDGNFTSMEATVL